LQTLGSPIMNLKHVQRTSIAVMIIIIAFLGLIVVQVLLFQKAQEANRLSFINRINYITQDIVKSVRKMPQLDVRLLDSSRENHENLKHHIKLIVDSTLAANAIQLKNEFGIYLHEMDTDSDNYSYQFGTLSRIINLNECANQFPAGKDYGSLYLTDKKNSETEHYHLAIYMPDTSPYLLSQISGLLFISIVIALLLIGSFVYFLKVIANQRKLSEMKNDFINNLTHEFKTPLFSISLASKFIMNDKHVKQDNNLNKYIQLIDKENSRLKNNVEKILQVAFFDSGNFILDSKAVSMHKLIHDVIMSFELAVKEKSGSITLELCATNDTINGDEIHLKNMLFNVVDNAIKYSNGRPIIKISTGNSLSKERNGETSELWICVSDKGIGMSNETKANIFEKFYRAHNGDIHDVKGFGLGLSYVKKIILAHKGNISIESELGQGTSFTIVLPKNG
jgi:two-component system phosphate regulon sensor histidine kinase PhoR